MTDLQTDLQTPTTTADGRPLPAGFRLRPYKDESDVAAGVAITNADMAADGVPNRETVDDFLAFVRHPNDAFDPQRDVVLAEVDGRMVGYSDKNWVDTRDGLREYRLGAAVLPEWRNHGIGTVLLEENERRARDQAAAHASGLPTVFGSWSSDRQHARVALLRKHGYRAVRWFFEMTRPLTEPIPDVPLPDGIEVRPVTRETIRPVWEADTEAFRDHWGGFDSSDEQLARWLSRPSFDPTLWVVAYDGDQVAGGVINAIETEENEALGTNRGWLDSVFTRRPWRKRGLARALIARSLVLLRERGLDQGILGVDANNPTGALGLYEKIGFTVAERSTAWRKPFDV
jgi:mycothiol synthase